MRGIDKAYDKGGMSQTPIRSCFVLLTLATALFALGCKKHDAVSREVISWQWPAMGTVASLSIRDGEADAALILAKAAIEEVNARFSVFDPISDVGQINAAAGTDATINLHPQTQHVLDASIHYYHDSKGAFNPLIGPLMEVWGFSRGGEGHAVFAPSAHTINRAQQLCDLNRLEYHKGNTVRLLDAGMKLDFGAIAKGYAVDIVFERLSAAGHTNMLVNLGGNMRASGVPSSVRKAWHIAIRDPRKALTDKPLGVVLLSHGRAIATSGSYEQYVDYRGKRYSHIIDPRTGFPVDDVLQVTIVAPTAMAADGLSTTCFVLGAEAGVEYLTRYPECEALFVLDDGRKRFSLVMTEGFSAVFEAGKAEIDE